ncbi:MAG: molybdate ABC transporter substrate-binding protein, partial [Phycisphaerae bacterium]|nr:molybdate ABC transporter substrate-binding protein [Phycisphaerae bacterium]
MMARPVDSDRVRAAASLGALLLASGLLAAALIALLAWPQGRTAGDLRLFCAAGIRVPIEQIIADFEKDTGVQVDAQYEGSHDLLNKLKIYQVGDLYLAGDNSYIDQAVATGLVREGITIARMKPVIVVKAGSPAEQTIQSVDDLLAPGLRLSIGDPDKAAIGRKTKKLLSKSGHWPRLFARVAENGATWGTVNDAANAVKIGSADAAIIWDAVARLPNYREQLRIVEVPELDAGEAAVTLGVCKFSKDTTTAHRFARYVTASDRGLKIFKEHGWRTADGDPWDWNPTLHIYSGGVNRLAIEKTIHDWANREGINVSTTFLGCGQLVSDMKAIRGGGKSQMFPAAYFACDLSYMQQVQGEFEDPVNLTSTRMVLLVHPKAQGRIKSINDLAQANVRFGLADK